MTENSYPVPTSNSINETYWEKAAEGTLAIQYCNQCQEYNYPPRVACPNCFSELEWVEASGIGTIYSYGIVHRPNKPEIFKNDVPFILCVVELDEGCRIVSNLINSDPEEVEIGDKVNVVFDKVDPEITLPKFEPA